MGRKPKVPEGEPKKVDYNKFLPKNENLCEVWTRLDGEVLLISHKKDDVSEFFLYKFNNGLAEKIGKGPTPSVVANNYLSKKGKKNGRT